MADGSRPKSSPRDLGKKRLPCSPTWHATALHQPGRPSLQGPQPAELRLWGQNPEKMPTRHPGASERRGIERAMRDDLAQGSQSWLHTGMTQRAFFFSFFSPFPPPPHTHTPRQGAFKILMPGYNHRPTGWGSQGERGGSGTWISLMHSKGG